MLNAPVLILGNKIDSPTAVSEDEIRSVFKIRSTGKVSDAPPCRRLRLMFSFCLILILISFQQSFKYFSVFYR